MLLLSIKFASHHGSHKSEYALGLYQSPSILSIQQVCHLYTCMYIDIREFTILKELCKHPSQKLMMMMMRAV